MHDVPSAARPGSFDRWVLEGPHQVVPGVYRLPLPFKDALRGVNVYAIECDAGLILIDSGVADETSREFLERGLKVLGAGLSDVVAFLVTHAHSDHYTQAISVRRDYRTKVMIGENEKHSIELVHTPGRTTLEAQLADLRSSAAARSPTTSSRVAWLVGPWI